MLASDPAGASSSDGLVSRPAVAAHSNGFYIHDHDDDDDDEQRAPSDTIDDHDDHDDHDVADDDDLSTSSGRRHGALLLPEEADMIIFESPYMTQWTQKRHLTGGNPKPRDQHDLPDWRMRERLRTMTAALVMCLNIGVDPPDVSKTNPSSKLICWMDPSSIEVAKALPAIGRNLQAQFETLSMKTRYKQYLDPIIEEVRRFCTSLRRTAKDERVLFYYNGFGVPKPTPGGEIWVFNKAYTQYIPVTLYDLQAWLGNPCIFVWDASSAGNVVVNFKRLAERRAEEDARAAGGAGGTRGGPRAASTDAKPGDEPHFPLRESIHLAACGPDEVLPMNPDLPADLFTCCLTSPIEISLRWFVMQNPLPSRLNVDMVMNIPGRLQDRRTPLGELNWIFTAITDTIAWSVLPRTIFRRLFRDDLMVAALLRNFLLAERIMRFYHCTPMSHPKLPPTHNHPLWDSWDLAVDQCLSQLPMLLAKEEAATRAATPDGPPMPPHLAAFEYRHSTFFSEQLMAFEVWLSQGGVSRRGRRRRADASKTTAAYLEADTDDEDEDDDQPIRDPPDQLPIVLQVLLSQVHRLRALILLSQFLDLGPWAVNLALRIGIFPYVLKLLQSPAADLKPVLIYIWARILAVDRSCQNDLLRDNGFIYFSTVLSPFQQPNDNAGGAANANNYPIPNVSEHRAMCAFILSVFCQDFPAGQQACLQTDAIDSCLEHLDHDDFLLRQWSALCIGQLWDDSSVGKRAGVSRDVHGKFACMLSDISPEVRAAVLYALGILLGASGSSHDPSDPNSALPTNPVSSRHAQTRPHCLGTGTMLNLEESRQRSLEVGIAVSMLATKCDPSPLVRKELVIALSPLVREYQGFFVMAAYLYFDREDRKVRARRGMAEDPNAAFDGIRNPSEYEEALLTRILTKLSLEEGLDEVDIATVPAFSTLFVSLLDLSADSHPEVASMASTVVDYITALMLTAVPIDASGQLGMADRQITPTSTLQPNEGYFPPMPRSKMSVANDRPVEYAPHSRRASGATAGISPGVSNAKASPVIPSSTLPPHAAHQPGTATRRSTSLAQTVKTIATLGYSRPPSPDSSSPDAEHAAHHADAAVPPRSTFLPPRVPAPRSNSARYVSPFVSSAASAATTETSTHDVSLSRSPSTPAMTTTTTTTPTPITVSMSSAAAVAAHRSASAESLAQIARLQDRRSAKSSGTGASTPGSSTGAPSSRSALADKLSTLAKVAPLPHGAAAHAELHRSRTASPSPMRSRSPAAPTMGETLAANLKVADALAAVVAADLHRFRDRAQIASRNEESPGSTAGHTPMNSPSAARASVSFGMSSAPPPTSNGDSPVSPASSSTHNLAIREVLPLKSKLFAWCSEYYTEPQMKCAETDEPGSVQYNVQTWKRERNERLIGESQVDVDHALRIHWLQQQAHVASQPSGHSTAPGVQVGAPVYLMKMHQFENHLITASEQDTVSVWDWTNGRLLTRFNNGNPPRTSITSLAFINEDAQSRLLVGSADGDVRIYANYDEPSWRAASAGKGPKLVSSMRALPHLVRSKRPSGLIVDWQQITGSLLTGGDSRFVRVWDAHRELCVCDIPTRVSSCVTSISSETDVGHIFVCGFGDGAIGVYDRRIPPELSLVRLWEEHANWVTNVHLQKRDNRELVSASTDGVVKVWDIRVRKSIRSKDWSDELQGKLSSMDVHDSAPIFALSSYPKPQRHGMGPQRTLLCNIDTQQMLYNVRPIVRHFSTAGQAAQASHAGLAGSGQAGGVGGGGGVEAANAASTAAAAAQAHGGAAGISTLLSPAIDTPASPFKPGMGSLAFHPHFPLLAFAGPDSQGYVGLLRAHVGPNSTAYPPAATSVSGSAGGMTPSSSTTMHSSSSSSSSVGTAPYGYLGSGGYGHGPPSVIDGSDQRHIPTLGNGGHHEPTRPKSLFRFSS